MSISSSDFPGFAGLSRFHPPNDWSVDLETFLLSIHDWAVDLVFFESKIEAQIL